MNAKRRSLSPLPCGKFWKRRASTAALVTPDRKLARRVGAELLRWDVVANDSAGDPLGASPIGVLARLAMPAPPVKWRRRTWLRLFAHPLLRLGLSRADIERRAALLEIGLLRSLHAAGGLAGSIAGEPAAVIARARQGREQLVSRIPPSSEFPKMNGKICKIFWFGSAPNSRRF